MRSRVDMNQVVGNAVLGGGVGYACATLPDILEPATNPNHRNFFHSYTTLGLTAYGAYKVHQSTMTHQQKLLLNAAIVSYCSHLLADSETPNSLPLI
ncbi:MAG TPA: hypothetical protein VK177_01800 [Flavobacteriales bacterium]|nr:hypothetical protein [Flavobacteriales bacterium]